MYAFHIHLIGILLAAIASMILGMVWYSPVLFGVPWMKYVGMTPEVMNEAKKDPAIKKRINLGYLGTFIFALLAAYILGLFLKNMFVPSIVDAIRIGFFAWLGFVAPSMSGEYLFNTKPKPWHLYAINAGYWFVSLLLMSAILFFFV